MRNKPIPVWLVLVAAFVVSTVVAFSAPYLQHRRAAFREASGITYLIEENFEGPGVPSNWFDGGALCDTSTSGLSLEASECASLVSGNKYLIAAYPTPFNEAEIWIRYRVRFTEDTSGYICRIYDGSLGQVGYLYRLTGGALYVANGSTQNNTVATTAINTTYWVWIRYKKGTGANGEAEVWFSTTSTKPGSGDNNAAVTTGNATANAGSVSLENDNGAIEGYIDEVRIAATSIP